MAHQFVNQIIFLKPYNKLFSLFGIMPIFDFKYKLIQRVREFKIYALIACLILSLTMMWSFVKRIQTIYRYLPVLEMILLDSADIISIVTSNYVLLSTAFWNANKWEQLLKLCLEVENFLNIKNPFKWYHKVSFWFFMWNFLIHFISFLHFYEVFRLMPDYMLLISLIMIYLNQYGFILEMFLINLILQNIRYKFIKITESMSFVCDKQIQNRNENRLNDIRNLSKMFRKTFEIVELVNDIFGMPIMCCILLTSVIILTGWNFAILYTFNSKIGEAIMSPSLLATILLYNIIYFVRLRKIF